MPIDFRYSGVDCRISCHWLNFSIFGIEDWRDEWDRFFPSYRIGKETKFHKISYQYDVSGMFLRRCVRGKAKNNPVEIELPGSFFEEGYDLDALFREIYSAGGGIKISHCDIALDYFGVVDRFVPVIAPNQKALQELYNPHLKYPTEEWTGFHVGRERGNRKWTVYNRVEAYAPCDGHFQGRENWWRFEIKVADAYAWKAFPEGHWFMSDIERVGALILQDRKTVDCGFFHDVADAALSGELILRQRVQASFEASRDKLLLDLKSRVAKFCRKFSLTWDSESDRELLSDLERRAIDVIRYGHATRKKAVPPSRELVQVDAVASPELRDLFGGLDIQGG